MASSPTLADTRAAWDRFVRGESAAGTLRPIIADSWMRCRAAGIDARQSSPRRLSEEETRARLRANQALLAAADPFLSLISVSLPAVPHHTVALADADACFLDARGSVPATRCALEWAPGYDWSERGVGTNAVGTALVVDQPILVVGPEHFSASLHHCAAVACPIHTPAVGPAGVLAICTHADDLHSDLLALAVNAGYAIERELPRASGDIEALAILASVSTFTAHELVSPLSGLQTGLSALAGARLDERCARLVNSCQQLTRKMLDMASDLRALGGVHRPELDAIAVRDLTEGLFRSLVPAEGYRVSLELEPAGPPPLARANGRLLSLALRNLVKNALDVLPDGGALGARLESDGSRVSLVVWDEGPGVPPEYQPSLFRQPFTTKRCGSGLGLLLVKTIIERVHGGQVSYTPNEPHGARFRIDLSAAPSSSL